MWRRRSILPHYPEERHPKWYLHQRRHLDYAGLAFDWFDVSLLLHRGTDHCVGLSKLFSCVRPWFMNIYDLL